MGLAEPSGIWIHARDRESMQRDHGQRERRAMLGESRIHTRERVRGHEGVARVLDLRQSARGSAPTSRVRSVCEDPESRCRCLQVDPPRRAPICSRES